MKLMDTPPEEAPTDASEAESAEQVRGPHLWLNWQGMRAGQPARSSSYGESSLVHPLWEEYALYSDAPLGGELELGPYQLLTTYADDGGRIGRVSHQLVLRYSDHLEEARAEFGDADVVEESGWTGGSLGDQMAAVLALALARRVRAGGVVRQGFDPGDPRGRPMTMGHRLPVLGEPGRRPMLPGVAETVELGDASDLLRTYATLSAADAAVLTRAAGQYADALWWADADPRVAWIKLVGALETAANQADKARDDGDAVALLKRHRGALYGRLRRIDPEAARVAAEALAGTLRVEAKLIAFTLDHAPAPPAVRPQRGRVDFDDLEPALRTVYDLRSRDLHDGIPFPWPLCEPPTTGTDGVYECFPGIAIQASGGTWPAERLPMYLHVFAHIVGGVLRNWWSGLPYEAPTTEDAATSSRASPP